MKTPKQNKRIKPKSKGTYLGGRDVEGTYILEEVNKKVGPKLCKIANADIPRLHSNGRLGEMRPSRPPEATFFEDDEAGFFLGDVVTVEALFLVAV